MELSVGKTKITLLDQLGWAFGGGRIVVRYFLVGSLLGIIWALYDVFIFGMALAVESYIIVALVFPVVGSAMTLVIQAVFIARLKPEQRDMIWEISKENGVKLYDAAGVTIAFPWSHVKKIRETKSAFYFYVKPAGARYIPKRAFVGDALDRASRLIRTQSELLV